MVRLGDQDSAVKIQGLSLDQGLGTDGYTATRLRLRIFEEEANML